jgi:hypothetical protein
MIQKKWCTCLARLVVLFAAFAAKPGTIFGQYNGDWSPLFNGRDLSGWVLVNTPSDTWAFEDGMLTCTGKPIGEIRTEKMYQNFEMEIEWRHMKPAGNAGIFVWADDITSRGVPFHRGIEVQVLENDYGNTKSYSTHGDIFPIHGADMTPINGRGGKRAFPTSERSHPSPQWNQYRIVCNNGEISLAVNGEVVTQGKNAIPREGYICLESEGGVVHYRNARIRELPNTALDPKMVATADRGFKSLYSGLDLRGWKSSANAEAAWKAQDWTLTFDGSVAFQDAFLESQAEYELRGFVFDVRFTEKSERLVIELPGASKPLSISHAEESPFALLLEARGAWNRIEGIVEGDAIQILVNGTAIVVDQKLAKGTIGFRPSGPVELANIFVR